MFPFRGFAYWITWRRGVLVSSTNWGGGSSRRRSSRKADVFGGWASVLEQLEELVRLRHVPHARGCGTYRTPYQGILECRLAVVAPSLPLSFSSHRKALWESMNVGITTRQTVGGISGIVLMALGFCVSSLLPIKPIHSALCHWFALVRNIRVPEVAQADHSTSDLMRIVRWKSSQKDGRCHWLALPSQQTQ